MTVDLEPAAGAWVVGGQQHEACGKHEDAIDARDVDRAGIDRAAQGVERVGSELEGLVQEERAAVREAGLARPNARATADERLGRDGVVRCPERAPQAQRGARVGLAGHRMDAAHLGRLALVEQWQQAGGRVREQRLADPRRSGEGEVMASRDRDLQRAPRNELADH